MINGRKLRAIIPARGGSKGIHRKNLYQIDGMSLVELSIRFAKKCTRIDDIYVSTDDAEIYAIAKKLKVETPGLRPPELASDKARTVDVLRNLVSEGLLGIEDCVLLLQPTSPLRTMKQLAAIYELFYSNWEEADAIVSVSELTGQHPYKSQKLEKGYLTSLFNMDSSVPRQSLEKIYMPNGAFYLGKMNVYLVEDTCVPRRSLPYIMSSKDSVNLDTPLDLILLEALVEKGMAKIHTQN